MRSRALPPPLPCQPRGRGRELKEVSLGGGPREIWEEKEDLGCRRCQKSGSLGSWLGS